MCLELQGARVGRQMSWIERVLVSLHPPKIFFARVSPKIESWRGEPPETHPKREGVRGGKNLELVLEMLKDGEGG